LDQGIFVHVYWCGIFPSGAGAQGQFFNRGFKVNQKSSLIMQHDTLIFTPPFEIMLIVRQVVIAIILTPVRHKRHMQFLTSVPNFGGSANPP